MGEIRPKYRRGWGPRTGLPNLGGVSLPPLAPPPWAADLEQ